MKQFMNTIKGYALVAAMLVAVMALNSCKTQSLAVNGTQVKSKQAIPMILDSDFGSSTDDLFALMMLHHYIDDGLVDLKGVIVDREGEKNAGVVDIFNTYYGHPDIPVGLERNLFDRRSALVAKMRGFE